MMQPWSCAHRGATLITTTGLLGIDGPSMGLRPASCSALKTDADAGLLWSYCTIRPACPFIMTLQQPTATCTPGAALNAAPRSAANRSKSGMYGIMLTSAPGATVSRIILFASSVSEYSPRGAGVEEGGGAGAAGRVGAVVGREANSRYCRSNSVTRFPMVSRLPCAPIASLVALVVMSPSRLYLASSFRLAECCNKTSHRSESTRMMKPTASITSFHRANALRPASWKPCRRQMIKNLTTLRKNGISSRATPRTTPTAAISSNVYVKVRDSPSNMLKTDMLSDPLISRENRRAEIILLLGTVVLLLPLALIVGGLVWIGVCRLIGR